MPIIDTPAEGFPLPAMDPPSRVRWDVGRLLSRGSKARAVQRAGHDVRLADTLAPDYAGKVPTDLADAIDAETADHFARLDGEVAAAVGVPRDILTAPDLFDRETGIGYHFPNGYALTKADGDVAATALPSSSVLDGELARRIAGPGPLALLTANFKRLHDTDLTNAFDAGRAYERGATLRRNVGAKSLGSRRVQAQGVASDYLRDDPERGALHAAMVLAGFLGHDPATVTL